MKRITAIILTALMVLSLCACGEKNSGQSLDTIRGEFTFRNEDSADLVPPANGLDPSKIYSSLTYIPEMFYGRYRILDSDKAESLYAKQMSYIDLKTEYAETITAIPFEITAGPENLGHVISNADEHNWLRANFYTENGTMTSMLCAYTVDGNTLTLQPMDNEVYEYNRETGRLRYALRDEKLVYTFSFRGMELTLTHGDQSLTLHSNLWAGRDEALVNIEGYRAENSPAIDGVDGIVAYWSEGKSFIYTLDEARYRNYGVAAKMYPDGLMTMVIPGEDSSRTLQFVYFNCGRDGVILADGKNTYRYTTSWQNRYHDQLGDNVSVENADKLGAMSDDKIQEILAKRVNLLEDLSQAYADAGMAVRVNPQSGEIALDAAILFDTNETQIGPDGKAFLRDFMKIYTDIVFSDAYRGFISHIVVEGHTDTNGGYDMNLALSQARADTVRDYCLSDECGVDSYLEQLNSMLLAQGYSYDKPVYSADGTVDMDASRRVSFLFFIDLDKG